MIFDDEFLKLTDSLPSLKNYVPPEKAEDICWKCNGTTNVDKVGTILLVIALLCDSHVIVTCRSVTLA